MNEPLLINVKKIYSFERGSNSYQSMLIESGKIKELAQAPLPYNFKKISYPDNYVVPGFIDSHTHILGTGLQTIFPDAANIASLTDLFDKIADAYQLAQELKFLVVFNFEPENTKEKRYPTSKELNKVLNEFPLLVYRIDGHSGIVNSRGLEEILDTQTPSLETGFDYDQNKQLTGVLRGKVYEFTARHFNKKMTADLRLQAFFNACDLARKAGITTIVTMLGTEVDNITCELLVENKSKLPIDVIPFYQTKDISRVQRLGLPRIGGCILIDGSFGSHTAALLEPYDDKTDTNGILYLSDETLEKFYRIAEENNLQTAVHAIGDRAVEQVIRILEKVLPNNRNRHRIEHCELLNEDIIKRIGALGLIVSVQPTFEYYWGGAEKMYSRRLGQRFQLTNPYRKLIDSGIILCGGSDSPITPLDPLLGIKTTCNMPTPQNSISLLEAYQMFTYYGAFSVFEENRIGSLQLNFQPDFVVLVNDPLQSTDNEIIEVFKNGKSIYKK